MAVLRGRARSGVAWVMAGIAVALAGCASPPPPPASQIKLMNAFVMQPGGSGSVSAYLVIANRGQADVLLSARSGAAGSVALIDPVAPGSSAIRTLRSVPIPAGTVVRMSPAGLRLVLLKPGPIRTGKDVTLTLVFARAGTITIQAQVTNSQTGGSSYFGL
jgi:copper(I)-binding protein